MVHGDGAVAALTMAKWRAMFHLGIVRERMRLADLYRRDHMPFIAMRMVVRIVARQQREQQDP